MNRFGRGFLPFLPFLAIGWTFGPAALAETSDKTFRISVSQFVEHPRWPPGSSPTWMPPAEASRACGTDRRWTVTSKWRESFIRA